MKATTTPASRFGWQGTTLNYVIKADGATELRLPKEGIDGVQARITNLRHVGNGVEAQLAVDVKEGVFV